MFDKLSYCHILNWQYIGLRIVIAAFIYQCMNFELFVTEGLGDNSYLVLSDGEGALIDP